MSVNIENADIDNAINFLIDITKDVTGICVIHPGDEIGENSSGVSRNGLGIDVVTPAGTKLSPDAYPSFWLRDFVMSVPAGFYSPQYLHDCVVLFAKSQRDKDWSWEKGFVPAFTPAEHITFDGGSVYFPGSYYTDEKQGGPWGPYPPMDNSFFFVELVYHTFKLLGADFLKEQVNGVSIIDRASRAFLSVESDDQNGLARTTPETRAVDFGFCDVVYKTGYVLFGSCLRYRSAQYLAEMMDAVGCAEDADSYRKICSDIQTNMPNAFGDESGFLLAATDACKQRDVWGTAFAVYIGALQGEDRTRACAALRDAYLNGTAISQGSVRHILTTDNWSETTAWERCDALLGDYQNGGYWLTPAGWYIYALSLIDCRLAKQLFMEMVDHIKSTDYRTGSGQFGPYEFICPKLGKIGNPVNLTSVACPLSAIQRIQKEGLWEKM